MASSPEPGWYPDPKDPDGLRWWDGERWTAHTGRRRKEWSNAQFRAALDAARPITMAAPDPDTQEFDVIVLPPEGRPAGEELEDEAAEPFGGGAARAAAEAGAEDRGTTTDGADPDAADEGAGPGTPPARPRRRRRRLAVLLALLVVALVAAGAAYVVLAEGDEPDPPRAAVAPVPAADETCVADWNDDPAGAAAELRVTLGQFAGAYGRVRRVDPLPGTAVAPQSCALTVGDPGSSAHLTFVAGVQGREGFVDLSRDPKADGYRWPRSPGESNVTIEPDGTISPLDR